MRRVRGTYNGSAVILREQIDLPPDTEVEVLILEPGDKTLAAVLDELDQIAAGESLSQDEVAALVHEVREHTP